MRTRRCSSPISTVIVDKGRIVAVGPAKSAKVPAGAQVIDGRGKTLMPGLWDCHMHIANDYTGLQELSMGVTSVRDPGNDDSADASTAARAPPSGELLMPNVYPSSLIDGKGPYTAQVANVATSEAEAIALVDKAKANGFIGVKFYGTLEQGLAAGGGGRSAQARPARARPHSRRHAPARGHQRRLRRDHAHQLDRDAGDAGRASSTSRTASCVSKDRAVTPRISTSTASRSRSSLRRWRRRASTAIRRWWRSRGCTCRRTATCRRRMRRSSARCRRRPSAASASAASRCRRT